MKVLIIDDEIELVRLTEKWIRSKGYEVYSYFEGKGAIDHIREVLPDAILLDLLLPDISGIEIFYTLKADPELSKIPVLFFTSYNVKEWPELVNLWPEGIINKPYDPKYLLSELERVLVNPEESKP